MEKPAFYRYKTSFRLVLVGENLAENLAHYTTKITQVSLGDSGVWREELGHHS